MRRVAEMQAEGASPHTIAGLLTHEGRVTPEGKRWYWRSVARFVAGQP